jgi:hypothetical protein
VNKLDSDTHVADPTLNLPDEDLLFRLLRQLDAAPDASQRASAEALGVSLGRFNALLRAATEAGLSRSPKSNRPTGGSARPIC